MFNCEYCNNKFSTKGNLIQHVKKAKFCLKLRGEMSLYKCNFCDKRYTSKQSLSYHGQRCVEKRSHDIETKYIEMLKQKDNIISDLQQQITNLQNKLFGAATKPTVVNNTRINKQSRGKETGTEACGQFCDRGRV